MFCVLGFTLLLILTRADVFDRWPSREFRGAWVATVANIDWPSERNLSTKQQKSELTKILDKLQQLHFNAIVLQIRPEGDAFYNSSFEPWSVYLGGCQGTTPDPYYDPLQFALEESHRRSIELHAWFNPYRARNGNSSKSDLAPNHMVNRFPKYAYSYGNNVIMDPGAKVVQDFIFRVFLDVVKRYNIDGVHIDDYFYPYPVAGETFPDRGTYQAYIQSSGSLSLADWRRHNVDSLIKRLYDGIKNIKSYVKFGISPFGLWRPGHPPGVVGPDAYSEIYGDSRKWFREGWVDYLTPQLYWRINNTNLSYTALLDWWLQQNFQKRHLYAGNYAGKVVLDDWPLKEIECQVQESRKRRNNSSLGNIQFSMKFFRDNSKGISDMFKMKLYTSPALPPVMPWINATSPIAPSGVRVIGRNITWNSDFTGTIRSWVIYKLDGSSWNLIRVLHYTTVSVMVLPGQYSVAAMNRLGKEGPSILVAKSMSPVG